LRKAATYLAAAAAVLAIAGCDKKQGETADNTPVKLEQIKPPPGGTWTDVVNPTPGGGFVMGNPDAKVKLVEYGSMTCPHCKEFDDQGVPKLVDQYVKSGQVSWEFRNYVRDGLDVAASLIARCNGAKGFFPLTRALYSDQMNWVKKVQDVPQEQYNALQSLPQNRQFVEMAKIAGFQDWAAARGVPVAKSTQCLTDQNAITQLVQMASDATTQFPNFPGTPTFIINGTMVENTATWDKLEPELKKAVGG
jgi:protein-disulfide isomerase